MKSLREFERQALASLDAYYRARHASRSHPADAALKRRAINKRNEGLKNLNALKMTEIMRGVKL